MEFSERKRELAEYTVQFTYKGELVPEVIDLQDFSEEEACRRGRNAIFMVALKDGREFELDQIEASIYEEEEQS